MRDHGDMCCVKRPQLDFFRQFSPKIHLISTKIRNCPSFFSSMYNFFSIPLFVIGRQKDPINAHHSQHIAFDSKLCMCCSTHRWFRIEIHQDTRATGFQQHFTHQLNSALVNTHTLWTRLHCTHSEYVSILSVVSGVYTSTHFAIVIVTVANVLSSSHTPHTIEHSHGLTWALRHGIFARAYDFCMRECVANSEHVFFHSSRVAVYLKPFGVWAVCATATTTTTTVTAAIADLSVWFVYCVQRAMCATAPKAPTSYSPCVFCGAVVALSSYAVCSIVIAVFALCRMLWVRCGCSVFC